MKVILLTRNSDFQIFCANLLWEKGFLHSVIIEDGNSYPDESLGPRFALMVRRAKEIAPIIIKRPFILFEYIKLFLNWRKYFGSREFHNQRLMGKDYQSISKGLPSMTVSSINSKEVKDAIRASAPNIVLVFGTSLIRSSLLESSAAKYVNMHWGWSPDYRGEGIVSALALDGIDALGVTVHIISEKIDGGMILYRARPTVDRYDNFYSIGLKLSLLGCELFIRTIEQFRETDELIGKQQDLSKGNLYDFKFMRSHPEFYNKGWINLKKTTI